MLTTRRPVPGFDGYYATEDGQIISTIGKHERVIRACPIARGYLAFKARVKPGTYVTAYVHRFVAMAFHGLPVPPRIFARHLDGNMVNNRPSNMRWGTCHENAADKHRHGTDPRGTRNAMSRLTDAQVTEIRDALAAGATGRAVAKRFGVSPMTISRIARGTSWSHMEIAS